MFDTRPRLARVPAPDATAAELREAAAHMNDTARGCDEHAAHLSESADRFRDQARAFTARAEALDAVAPKRPALTVVSSS